MKKSVLLIVCILTACTSIAPVTTPTSSSRTASEDIEFCPAVYRQGVLHAPFNVAFLHVQEFSDGTGGKRDDLLLSSFFNTIKDPTGRKVEGFTSRDLVARIPDLSKINFSEFDGERDIQVLSDLDGISRQVWPNETSRIPDDVLPFEGVISPQGFLSTPRPGRLTILNIDDPSGPEYVVDQSTFQPPRCEQGSDANQPWFYHDARFIDMNEDGLRDIVTVRSSLITSGGFCAPTGQLLWFRNPGADLEPDVEWDEYILVDTEPKPGGPEVNMNAYDINGDGVMEIIASHFFKHDAITIYGPPEGKRWSDIDTENGVTVRQNDIMRGQGRPFAIEIVDLNQDGKLDVLTSNHQGDQCFDVTKTDVPGRVLAIEQPTDGKIFDSDWVVHVLKDNIRATPTFPEPERGPGRLAPNRAVAFWPERSMETERKPWLVVGGDEASKVWILKPIDEIPSSWEYESAVVLDINDYYGENTTQTLMKDPQGISISTIGGLSWRYDRPGQDGRAEFYLPVFEARDIHVLSFRESEERITCVNDTYPACP